MLKSSKRNGQAFFITLLTGIGGKDVIFIRNVNIINFLITKEQRVCKPFLKQSSPAYKALESIVNSKSLIGD